MVRVLGSESGQDDLLLVGDQIPISIDHVLELVAIDDIGAGHRTIVAWQYAGRNQQALGEYRRFVGPAIAICVFQNKDFVIGGFTRNYLWIRFAARDPQPTAIVPIHVNRLRQSRLIAGKQFRGPAIPHLKGCQLLLRIRNGNIGQFSLCGCGAGQQSGDQRGKKHSRELSALQGSSCTIHSDSVR